MAGKEPAMTEKAGPSYNGGPGFMEGEILSRETSGGADPAGEVGQARRQAITILGAPVEAGASVPGAAMGPAMLRTAGIVKTLRDLGHDVEDRGDLAPPHPLVHAAPPEGKAHRFAHVAAWARLLARETYAVVRSGRTPIVLGGDHSLAMGSIGGVARHAAEAGRELFVLWLDAHSDFNTPLTSPSGNMHGMSAAMLSREPGLEAVFGERAAWLYRSGPAASVRHPVDRLGRKAALAGPRRRCRRHAKVGRRRLRGLDPPNHRPG